jgi:hypothetical protein
MCTKYFILIKNDYIIAADENNIIRIYDKMQANLKQSFSHNSSSGISTTKLLASEDKLFCATTDK